MNDVNVPLPDEFRAKFSGFLDRCTKSRRSGIEQIMPGASDEEIAQLERKIGIPLPHSYKSFLRLTRGFWLFGGSVQFDRQHPFFHRFPKINDLSAKQREVVTMKGGNWPPPSEGMLCFAEYFRDADGDQVLFDVSGGLVDGEYNVFYYSHETRPPFVEVLAKSFEEWLNEKCVQQMSTT